MNQGCRQQNLQLGVMLDQSLGVQYSLYQVVPEYQLERFFFDMPLGTTTINFTGMSVVVPEHWLKIISMGTEQVIIGDLSVQLINFKMVDVVDVEHRGGQVCPNYPIKRVLMGTIRHYRAIYDKTCPEYEAKHRWVLKPTEI